MCVRMCQMQHSTGSSWVPPQEAVLNDRQSTRRRISTLGLALSSDASLSQEGKDSIHLALSGLLSLIAPVSDEDRKVHCKPLSSPSAVFFVDWHHKGDDDTPAPGYSTVQ